MKKIVFIFLIVLTFSCGNSKEKQMLYDFQSASIKQLFSTSLEELDFKINSIEKIGEVTSSDSIKILKEELDLFWLGKNATQKEKDTLSYEYVSKELNKKTDAYQKIIVNNLYLGEGYKNDKYQEKMDKNIEASVYADYWKIKSDLYSKNPDSVLCIKYKASYSLTNPLLKIKQTQNSIYYTNASQTKFILGEKVDE